MDIILNSLQKIKNHQAKKITLLQYDYTGSSYKDPSIQKNGIWVTAQKADV